MKILSMNVAAACAIMATSAVQADRVVGSARADFSTNELIVPCVLVDNFNGDIDGQYFNIILDRHGNSLAYGLSFAEPADPAACETLSNFSTFIDDDDDSSDDDNSDVANLFVKCEVRSDRSKASVDAKDIAAGEYYAVLTSGENVVASATKFITGDEVEFDFDSEPDGIAEGAEELAADFIQDSSVTGEIFRVNGEVVAATTDEIAFGEPASCLTKN